MTRGAFSLLVYEKFEPLTDQSLVPRWCKNHFEIKQSTFDGYRFWQRRNGKGIWITPKSFKCVAHQNVAALGMLVMRKPPPKGKPTTVFLQRFGQQASRNVYVLSESEALRFLTRETLTITPHDDARGYALVRTEDRIIGCGRVTGNQLCSEIPKHWLSAL